MIVDAREHVGEPSRWVDVIELCRQMISVAMMAARSAPRSEPANSHDLRPSAIASSFAQVGQESEVHYRWHPYFGRKVVIPAKLSRTIFSFSDSIQRRRGPLSTTSSRT